MKPYSPIQFVATWLLLLSLLIHSARGLAQTVYVTVTGTNSNSATATSWANALSGTALQGALATAPPGTTFLVAMGGYKPTTGTDRAVSFVIPSGVQVYGGYAGSGSPGPRTSNPSSSTLSGQIGDPNIAIVDNSYHVVEMTNVNAKTRLDGFVITGGQSIQGGNYPNDAGGGLRNDGFQGSSNPTLANLYFTGNVAEYGGAIYNDGGQGINSPVLTNVSFSQNTATYFGGAMYNDGNNNGTSNPVLTNVSFSQNIASHYGGAIYNGGDDTGTSSPVLTNVSFSQNTAATGGAMYNDGNNYGTSNPVLTNVSFSQNTATYYGGAMYNDGSHSGASNSILTDVSFSQNTAGFYGGAMYNYGSAFGAGSPTLTRVTFSQNTAVFNGGAMYNNGQNGISSPILINSSFSQNTASNYGGAIYNYGDLGMSSPALTGVTFSQNTASYGGAMYNYGRSAGISNPALTNVSFSQNTATTGGAMYNDGARGTSNPGLTNVNFVQNMADYGGAMFNDGENGISSPTLTNVNFSRNTASYGGAMYNYGGNGTSSPVLTNVSFSQNTAATGGAMYSNGQNGTSQPDMTNSVVFGNGGSNTFVSDMSFGPAVKYSLLESMVTGYTPGPGTLTTTTSPFASTTTTQLAPGSLAVNRGNNYWYANVNGPATDLAGNPRIQGGTIDIGAYELAPDLTTLLHTLPSTAYGTTPVTLVIDVVELNAVTTGGLTTVHLSKDALLSLTLNPALSVVGGRLVQNSQWRLDSSDPDFYLLTTAQPVVGGQRLSVGLSGELQPGRTKGSLTISATVGNRLGESSVLNNADSDKVDYFQK